MSRSNLFFVYGCYGTLTVETITGKVVRYEPDSADDPEYSDIARIDISSYEVAIGSPICQGDYVCIMDLNFWSHDGQFFQLDSPSSQLGSREGDLPQPIIVHSKRTE